MGDRNGKKVSISQTFYTRIFRTKVFSEPNSKQRKAAQFAFVPKMRSINVDEMAKRSTEEFKKNWTR